VTDGAKYSSSTLSRTSSALMVSFLILTFSVSFASYVRVMGNRIWLCFSQTWIRSTSSW